MIKRKKYLSMFSIAFIILVFLVLIVLGTISSILQPKQVAEVLVNQNEKGSYAEQKEKLATPKGYEVQISYLDVINCYYEEFCNYCSSLDVDIEMMTYEEFLDGFYENETSIYEYMDYLKSYVNSFSAEKHDVKATQSFNEIGLYSSGSSSGDGEWYFNTGTSLPNQATYGIYNFGGVSAGDILYEHSKGGSTGHIAMIEGRFYDNARGITYIRTVEAIQEIGVCRGILDDSRFLARKGTLMHVPSATNTQKQNAVAFCLNQYGKPWKLQLNKPLNSDYWQCSTLVWAAYKNQGIDVEEKGVGNGVGITPHDVRDASTTSAYLSFE